MTLLECIRVNYSKMSAVEKRIADLLLEDPLGATNMTISHLATQAGVSEGSIVNFADRMGVRGFSALKLRLAREADAFAGFSFGSVTAQDTPWSALRKVTGNAVETLQRTCRSLRETELKAAAEALMTARRIDLYGAGDSALMAQDAYFHLMRIGLPAYAVTDYLTFSIAAGQLNEGCTAVAISHSGQTVEIVNAMKLAKRQGAKTVCITSFSDSVLARLCDVALVTSSGESERHEEAAASRLAQLLVLDSLTAYLSAQQGPAAVERLDAVELELARHRYQR